MARNIKKKGPSKVSHLMAPVLYSGVLRLCNVRLLQMNPFFQFAVHFVSGMIVIVNDKHSDFVFFSGRLSSGSLLILQKIRPH